MIVVACEHAFVLQDDENVYLLLEYCAKGELYQLLRWTSVI